MSTPSPFEIAYNVGSNIEKAKRSSRDTSALDQILSSTIQNPEQYENAVSAILSRMSPDRQEVAAQIIGQRSNQLREKQAQEYYKDFAKTLATRAQENPFLQTVADVYASDLPIQEKKNAIDLLSKANPSRQIQLERLSNEYQVKGINQKIKDNEERIKQMGYFPKHKEEVDNLKLENKELRQRRDKYYRSLDDLDVDEAIEKNTVIPEMKRARPLYDPKNNPSQKKRTEELIALYNGDKEKIEEALEKEFSLP